MILFALYDWTSLYHAIPSHASNTSRRVRYSPNSRSSFSLSTRKVSPGQNQDVDDSAKTKIQPAQEVKRVDDRNTDLLTRVGYLDFPSTDLSGVAVWGLLAQALHGHHSQVMSRSMSNHPGISAPQKRLNQMGLIARLGQVGYGLEVAVSLRVRFEKER
jgi:hypothetical protein